MYAIPSVGLLCTGCHDLIFDGAPDDDPAGYCGDGVRNSDEECDDGNRIDADACLSSCVAARCGDGVRRDGVEECDDGNHVGQDGCDGRCVYSGCGDGLLVSPELCDDRNRNDGDGCSASCQELDAIVRTFHITQHGGAFSGGFNLCTESYYSCYESTTCNRTFQDASVTISFALVLNGTVSYGRVCGSPAFSGDFSSGIIGTATVITTRQRYRIELRDSHATVALDCTMNATTSELRCTDAQNRAWTLTP
jgi:cysteine-rich repeat protein